MNQFALLYLRSDSTTVPIADAKLSGPRDAFEKRLLNSTFFELIEKRWHNIQFQLRPFLMLQGHSVSSNRDTRGRILNKAKRIVNDAINEEPPWKILSRKSRSLTWGWTDPYFLHWFGTHFFHCIFCHSLHFIIFEQFRFYNPIKTILTYLQHLHQ